MREKERMTLDEEKKKREKGRVGAMGLYVPGVEE